MIIYPFTSRPRAYFLGHFPGRQIVLDPTEEGWIIPDWESLGTGLPQPSAEEVGAYQRPGSPLAPPHQIEPEDPEPVTDVERASAALASRRRTREDVIFSDAAGLVATCYAWLQRECIIPGGGKGQKTASQALQAGQELCSTTGYGVALRAWIDFAAPDFYQAMSAPDESRPWLEWVPAGESKSIRETILDRVYLATYGTARK